MNTLTRSRTKRKNSMKTSTWILMLALASAAGAQTAPDAKPSPAKTAAPKPSAKPVDPAPKDPPASAEKVDELTYRWKDAKGDFWVYKKTPFGWSKIREKELTSYQRPETNGEGSKVSGVRGDEVSFERSTPFGTTRWTKKKGELNPDESAALEAWTKANVNAGIPAASVKE
jgi:hypothetical protein